MARWRLLTKLRVHHGLFIATIVEGRHEGVLHASCGRSRVPLVTLRANAQELQVSTAVEENAGDASACGPAGPHRLSKQ